MTMYRVIYASGLVGQWTFDYDMAMREAKRVNGKLENVCIL